MKKDEEILVGVDVIFQAENVLQPSVMLQAYHLLQVRLQMFKLLLKQLSSQEVKTLTVEDCEDPDCKEEPVKLANTLAREGGEIAFSFRGVNSIH